MPELPEVETARRLVHEAASGRIIRRVVIEKDPIVFEKVSPALLQRALTGRTVSGSGRWGKHFWLELDARPWLVFHFGMTGWMHVYRRMEERPRFMKIELELDDGIRVAYRDPRRIGRVRLRHDPRREPPIGGLGFDPLHGLPPVRFFLEAFALRAAPVKAVLLDQTFSAGVGNWIADEVLYQSAIRPDRRACDLERNEVGRLRRTLGMVIRRAVEVGSDDKRFPRTWLFHYRWGKVKGARDGHGHPIEFGQIGGRTTAWVPAIQN